MKAIQQLIPCSEYLHLSSLLSSQPVARYADKLKSYCAVKETVASRQSSEHHFQISNLGGGVL
ncbi:hypothetical protein [Snodgrassella sp. CS2]|uniref:hypothetical protein n=1 Tax=Snodgrassella sp. CS2 TaxID=3418953 RepID=UPI003D011DF1